MSMLAALLPALQIVQAPAAVAAGATGGITLHVQSARTVNTNTSTNHFIQKGDAVTEYKWLVNLEDTGDPGTRANPLLNKCLPATAPGGSTDPDFADTCPWPSIRRTSGQAPIIAQGDQTELADAIALGNIPTGKYLISVLAGGYKIGGAHFTVTGGATTPVVAELDPSPLPLTTLRLEVFNDNTPVDATYEVDAEQGLRGFTAHLYDVLGDVSTDYYGNALCTKYMHVRVNGTLATDAQAPTRPIAFDANNRPIVDPASTGVCTSSTSGEIVIQNLGPNRYAATVSPPLPEAGQTYQWVQTTTLEGGHDHDIWSQEGATGYDTEQQKGAELVPFVQFGFVRTQAIRIPPRNVPTGEIKGVVVAGLPYIGGQNGQTVPETGFAGAKFAGPISKPWVALSNLDLGDQQVFAGRGNVDGSFDVKNVPDGTYQLTVWDDPQDYILWSFNVVVSGGQTVDVGNKMIVGWFTHLHGKVFIDSNGNGKLDAGEHGVPGFPLSIRERDNSLMDQASAESSTDSNGAYDIRETYPLGKWLIFEGFDTRYQTTGITYKGDNETKTTTELTAAVDFNFLPIIGLGGQIDIGVQPYATGTNGGIVGTVTYDTTRNELDAADTAAEPYQPGVPGVGVRLFVPTACTAATPADIANTCRQGKQIVPLQIDDPNHPGTLITNPDPDRGAFVKGPEIQDAYTSEEWAAPRGCTARMYDGQPLTDQMALPQSGAAANRLCVEAPMMGVAIGSGVDPVSGATNTVNGNYGFAGSKLNLFAPGSPKNPAPLRDLALYAPLHCGAGAANRDASCPAGSDYDYDDEDLPAMDYIVSVDIPNAPVDGKPMYKVTKEEDVNVFDGDGYLPQQNFPPTTQDAAEDPAGPPDKTPLPPSQPPSQTGGIVSPCAGPLHTVDVTSETFNAGGGSPFQGYDMPLCGDKLVTVRAGQATAPNFSLFTDVPLPTHFWGLTLNDLGLTLDKRSVNYGEAQGLPFVPVGLYDWQGRLIDTVHTDFNGLYEALEPSTSTYNCPVPAGPCANMYRFVGNDPGQPGHLNSDYNSRFRTIATNFQGWPGLFTVTDEAPTQVASTVLVPGSTVANDTICDLGSVQPQLLAVDKVYVRPAPANRVVTITGFGFGATGVLKLNNTPVSTTSWTDKKVVFTVPTTVAVGPAVLTITNSSSNLSSVNGLTLHVLNAAGSTASQGASAANPRIAEVGPGKPYATIQAAIEAARPVSGRPYWLVVVYPKAPTASNPTGEYTENVIVHHQVRIQGVGPGGFDSAGTFVPGSIIDGAGFNPDNTPGTNWIALLGSLNYSGDPAVPDAAVMTVLDDPALANLVPASYPTAIDGFTVTGGAQSDFPVNINEITGGFKTPYGANGALVTQGGGIYVHSNVRNLRLTDNVIKGNGGSYGGGVRVGTPYVGNNRNYGLVLSRNQIRDNGGTNLAGGVGLFQGSDGYQIDSNALCGNFSAEYGGAISAFGYNNNTGTQAKGGTISHNRIWFNQSYDEGAGIMIAGELPSNPNNLSEGSGPVKIDANVIQANLANDDGGGIRLLMTSGSHITRTSPETISITNNTIANNVSTHEGGGIAMDDAAFVNIVNNTVAKNLSTATAVTSDGQPAPAGLSTAANSAALQARLSNANFGGPNTTLALTKFSNPALLNNVFWDNRAGNFDGGYVYGIGGTLPDGSANTVNDWDMGVVDVPGALLNPTHSVVQTAQGTTNDASNSAVDPGFTAQYDVTVNVLASRSYPAFRQSVIVAEILPPSLMGNYHLAANTSSAYGLGAASTTVTWNGTAFRYVVNAPTPDIDGDPRPSTTGRFDAGSDQVIP